MSSLFQLAVADRLQQQQQHHHQHLLLPHQNLNSPAFLGFCLKVSTHIRHLKQIHARLLRASPSSPAPYLLLLLTSKLLHLNHHHHLSYARHVFDQIPHCANQFIWTSLIRSHSLHHLHHFSLSLFRRMHLSSVHPTPFTLSSVLSSCSRLGPPSFPLGSQSHALLLKSFPSPHHPVLHTSLLHMYSSCGSLPDALRAFRELPHHHRDVVSWTAMLAALAKAGLMSHARRLFDSMPARNVVSWTAMVAGYASSGHLSAARQMFDAMPHRNGVSWTAMIAGYGKCGDVAEAARLFRQIPVPDPASWAAMIACYAQNGSSKEAVDLFWEMRDERIEANEVALVAVVSACTQLGDPTVSSSISKHIEESCSELMLVAANALINMHAKCSDIKRAWELFNRMPEKDVISYTSLIAGLADHGRAEEALEVFEEMRKAGVEPNQITFVGVLNACSYSGMVDAGCKYFQLMRETYNIVPLTEHYACMVDLLGRSGRLKEARGLAESMPGAPDAGVWGALLGACSVHCNAELGEIAARRLFEIEPENTGNYVLLSNIYATLNRWDDAERARVMMWERGMTKSPGCSWISR